jgi:hypothetical protein
MAGYRTLERQDKDGARLIPMPGAYLWEQLDITFYDVSQLGIPNMSLDKEVVTPIALAKQAPSAHPSAKLLITQGEWR